ncbi:aspartate aminotransferase family protein [Kocuria palustris]|uniref:aspartate aminotransferase family protein n=1 Tax=Kocuria palustris TaxID=71999 RepID=UPI0011A718BF|nr:aminotransferase class III-fold pyridoxal phosphate-dependent enzyme [Kocuria palustris]
MTRSRTDWTPDAAGEEGTLYARDAAAIAVSEHLRFFPLEVDSASGSVLRTPAGRELIDLSAGWGAAAVGYAHPQVAEAVAAEAARMPGVGVLSAANPTSTRLAERLLESVPLGGSLGPCAVHLGLTGSDANSAALRAVRAWSDRPGILVFENSYHGGLGPAQHASGFYAADGVPLDGGVEQVPYGDAAAAVAALETERFAAVVVEPIMADGGLIIPPSDFLPALREACDRTGTLLMVDEVKVGMGRTGSLLASGCDGVVADVVTLGKGLGGGMPLSAAIAPREVWAAAPGASLLTLAGNPVCAAAGLAVLDVVAAQRLPEQAAHLGQELSTALAALARRCALVHDVRSRGIVAGIELRRPDGSAAGPETAAAVHRAFELGAVAYPVGPESNIIELTPALTISRDQLLRGVEILGEAVADVDAGRVDLQAAAEFGGW